MQHLSKLLTIALVLITCSLNAQFGYGLTVTNDLYHRYTNPTSNISEKIYESSGNAILNIGVGPKIWIGGSNFSISAEASACIGLTSFAIKDYKGLGTVAFPMLVNLNFKGLSGLDSEARTGFSLGGGIQYTKTELYGLSDKYENKGVKRKLFQTYLINAAYGFGLQGFAAAGFVRYGFHPDNDAKTLSLGIQWDFNSVKLKKRFSKASEL